VKSSGVTGTSSSMSCGSSASATAVS
jgi:hypothetical protein